MDVLAGIGYLAAKPANTPTMKNPLCLICLLLLSSFSFAQSTADWQRIELERGEIKIPPDWVEVPNDLSDDKTFWVDEGQEAVFSINMTSVPLETTVEQYRELFMWDIGQQIPDLKVLKESSRTSDLGPYATVSFKAEMEGESLEYFVVTQVVGSEAFAFALTKSAGLKLKLKPLMEEVFSTFRCPGGSAPDAYWVKGQAEGFSLRYPGAFWDATERNPSATLYLINPIAPENGEMSDITVKKSKDVEGASLEDLAGATLKYVRENGKCKVMSMGEKAVAFENSLVMELDVEVPTWGRSYQRMVFMRKDGFVYTVVYRIGFEHRNAFAGTLDLILNSVQITSF